MNRLISLWQNKFTFCTIVFLPAAILFFLLQQRPHTGTVRTLAQIPDATLECAGGTMQWEGLIPGKTTRDEVIQRLGPPDEEKSLSFSDFQTQMVTYPLESPFLKRFPEIKQRIYFKEDDTIDWMEITVADIDGKFHTVREYGDMLGYEFDIALLNSRQYAQGGFVESLPEKIYVWSECGIALIAFSQCETVPTEMLSCQGISAEPPESQLIRRLFIDESKPIPTLLADPDDNDIVMTLVLFQPTTYEGFTAYYRNIIPYDTWYYFWKPSAPTPPTIMQETTYK